MGHLDGTVDVTGAGKCFSAGVDLRAIVDGGAEYTDRFITSLSAAFLAVFDHPAPVVAAVNGHAIAGGCVFAIAADVRLMSAGTIGITELAVGVPFPIAAPEMCRYGMGRRRGAQRCRPTPSTARGWIDEVVAAADLIPRAIAVARELGQHAPTAYAATKEQLHRPARTTIDAGAETDAKVRASWMSDDTRARITAFIDALARD